MNRFALYLQKEFSDYWVDCEFNKQFYKGVLSEKIINGGKKFVDIIISQRGQGRDFLCFEIKREGKGTLAQIERDRNELKTLTSCKPGSFQYEYGFFITFGKKFERLIYELYKKGEMIENRKFS